MGDDRSLIQVTERMLADAEEAFRLNPTPENERRIRRAWSAVRSARKPDPAPTHRASDVLDVLDPPAWEPAPPDATRLIRRCHELRTVPIKNLSVEDLRLLIGQTIALPILVPMALTVLRSNPLTAGDFYDGDLLNNVLRIDDQFWQERRDLAEVLRSIVQSIALDRLDGVPAELREAIRQAAAAS